MLQASSQALRLSDADLPRSAAGHLVIIGGNEDKVHDKLVLRRFVELTARREPKIVVLTAASNYHEEISAVYDRAFGDLGVTQRKALAIHSREDANHPAVVEDILSADGIFMTGGDQRRLLALIGGTAAYTAMHRAFIERGSCVAGTSAGASAMSAHMIAEGQGDIHPEKGVVSFAVGLGFLQRAVVDQHFSERRRLGRLMAVVAQNPSLLGIGIDEDTALVVERGSGFEVIGDGAVTLVDGRQMSSNFLDIGERELIELINVRLHLLPAGASYVHRAGTCSDAQGGREINPTLHEIVDILSSNETVS
ncbi:cyanophycinase [Caldimonas brevitalea]|uniref:Cyanophycinase n=1 Tax=Caldimonas brevitalea TaxID=413882 RepID=A0A0G3BMV0_9BURK|nr:cyanophycinase [Caldimonas brevitalea]AKJ27855.1 cyanophycinase [Caldimonas brevitalea]